MPPGHRFRPFQAAGRLCLCLAIKLSILQESLPTVFTAKWPKDTAATNDFFADNN
jgi:hypothetical protein